MNSKLGHLQQKLMKLGAVEIRWRVLPARLSSIGFIYHQWFGGICLWKFVAIAGILLTSRVQTGMSTKNDTVQTAGKLPVWSPFSGSILVFCWFFFFESTFARVLMRVYREYLFGSKFISSECVSVGFGRLEGSLHCWFSPVWKVLPFQQLHLTH